MRFNIFYSTKFGKYWGIFQSVSQTNPANPLTVWY